MAQTKTGKPKGGGKPKVNPGQGSMDFNGPGKALVLRKPHPNDSFTRTQRGAVKYTGDPLPARRVQPSPFQGGNGGQLIVRPQPGQLTGGRGNGGGGSKGGELIVRPQPQPPTVVPRPVDGGKVNTPNPGPVRPRPVPGPPPPTPDFRVSPRPTPGPVPPRGGELIVRPKPGALQVVDKVDDAGRIIKGVVKAKPKGRWGLLAAGLGAAALGTGYLMSRRNENEDAARPQQAGANISIPGRNAPPSSGNEADRALYPAPDDTTKVAGTKAPEPGLSERVRNNQKANRSPGDYLGEAFDATIKRGRDVGRKHLQGMLVRDSVDDTTARNLMSRYDKEIGAQRTLKDYKSEGVAQKFDRENPGKAGRILDEYRGMGRKEGAAPAGATYAQIKERALR